jgi:CheY-like chemotaxis protein
MPELDGFDATRRIRALDVSWADEIPIIALTANVFKEDREKCLAAGMDDHLGKPFDQATVFESIQKHLRRR